MCAVPARTSRTRRHVTPPPARTRTPGAAYIPRLLQHLFYPLPPHHTALVRTCRQGCTHTHHTTTYTTVLVPSSMHHSGLPFGHAYRHPLRTTLCARCACAACPTWRKRTCLFWDSTRATHGRKLNGSAHWDIPVLCISDMQSPIAPSARAVARHQTFMQRLPAPRGVAPRHGC